jgi:hypothetical protein
MQQHEGLGLLHVSRERIRGWNFLCRLPILLRQMTYHHAARRMSPNHSGKALSKLSLTCEARR